MVGSKSHSQRPSPQLRKHQKRRIKPLGFAAATPDRFKGPSVVTLTAFILSILLATLLTDNQKSRDNHAKEKPGYLTYFGVLVRGYHR
jgi:hypothetical protein